MTEPTRATVTQADWDLAGILVGPCDDNAEYSRGDTALMIAQYREDAVRQLRNQLADAVYQVTHLTTCEEDSRYRPVINSGCVDRWRACLSATPAVPDPRDEKVRRLRFVLARAQTKLQTYAEAWVSATGGKQDDKEYWRTTRPMIADILRETAPQPSAGENV